MKGYYKNGLKIMFGAWKIQMSGLKAQVIPYNFKCLVGKWHQNPLGDEPLLPAFATQKALFVKDNSVLTQDHNPMKN